MYSTHSAIRDFLFLLNFNYFNILITVFVHDYLEVFVYVCIHLYVVVCLRVCDHGEARDSTLGMVTQKASTLLFEIGFLRGTWGSPIQPGRLGQEPQVFAFLHLLTVGITSVATMSVFSWGCWKL